MLSTVCCWFSICYLENYLIIGFLQNNDDAVCLVIFLVDLNLLIFVDCLRFLSSRQLRSIRCLVSEVDLLDLFKAGHQKLVQVKTSERMLMPMRVWRQTSEKCLGWPAVGHDSIVEGQESVMIFVFSPAKVRTQWGFCASCLVFTKASRFRCGHKVCGVFDQDHAFSLDLCYGRVWA